MFDNIIVNIRTILPIAKTNKRRDDTLSGNYANESAIAFLEQSSNRDYSSDNTSDQRTMLNAVRSYFSQLYQKKSVSSHLDNEMLPRVYNYTDLQVDWDPIELKTREKFIEDFDNVIEKFVRVISVNDNNLSQRTGLFYVYILLFYSFIQFENDDAI